MEAKENQKTVRDLERERLKKVKEMRSINSLKNTQYQVITKTAKLKKVSKNQWKNYRKLADINKW